jgi:hypothetical protein
MLKFDRNVSTDRNIKKSLAIVDTSASKTDIKRRIIFEDDKEVHKKIKNMDIGNNMDVDEED